MAKKEYIERVDVKAMISLYEEWKCPPTSEALRAVSDIMREVHEIPAADVAPVVHGEWCKDGDWLVCLNCESEINVKNSLGVENKKNYCPNCGAKMCGGNEQ